VNTPVVIKEKSGFRQGLPDPEYEKRVLDVAKRALDDIPECKTAIYNVRWTQPTAEPVLVIEFTDPEVCRSFGSMKATPAVGVGLVLVRKDTLLDSLPDRKLLEGDRLRDHIIRSVHRYFEKHGVRISLSPDEGEHHAHV
jgi:hypothetical protein